MEKITFEGYVTTQTCEAKINGGDDVVVKLEDVRAAAFPDISSTAGLKAFTLALGNCTYAEDQMQKVRVYFRLPSGPQSAYKGYLTNVISVSNGGADGVGVQLTKDAAGTEKIQIPSDSPYTMSMEFGMELKGGTASHEFGVHYVKDRDYPVQPGKVSTSIEWQIVYL